MKARIACTMITLLAAAAIAPTARADDKADAKQIRALFSRLEQAFKNKDTKTILATSTADFTEKMPGGQVMNAQQSLAMMKQEFAATRSVKEMQMKPVQITVQGNQATVVCSDRYSGVIVNAQGQMGPKGKNHTMSMSGTSRATLVKEKGVWKVKGYEEMAMTMTMDGKPYNPMASSSKPHQK